MVAVKVAPAASDADGVKVAVVPVAPYETVPATGVAPWATVKVVLVMVAGSIGSLNVAKTLALVAAPVAALSGSVLVTVGAVWSAVAPVVKLQVWSAASAEPEAALAPVVMVPVYAVFAARLVAGVNVELMPSAAATTVPATDVVPCLRSIVVVTSDAGSMGSLKLANTLSFVGTPTAASIGLVAVTAGTVPPAAAPLLLLPQAARRRTTARVLRTAVARTVGKDAPDEVRIFDEPEGIHTQEWKVWLRRSAACSGITQREVRTLT
jgi:hypothetical protein